MENRAAAPHGPGSHLGGPVMKVRCPCLSRFPGDVGAADFPGPITAWSHLG